MPRDFGLSDQWRREARAERDRLHQLEARLDPLLVHRRELLRQIRELSTKERELDARRRVPQAEAERLFQESGEIGRRYAGLRTAREGARHNLEEAVVRRRELAPSLEPWEQLNPDRVRREIAELELRQQTKALTLDEENALIAELRKKAKDLERFLTHKEQAEAHARQRHEAEAAIAVGRAELARIAQEMEAARSERDQRRAEIPAQLGVAGNVVAELRETHRLLEERRSEWEGLTREIAEVEKEGRALLARIRQREEDEREILREYDRPVGGPTTGAEATPNGHP